MQCSKERRSFIKFLLPLHIWATLLLLVAALSLGGCESSVNNPRATPPVSPDLFIDDPSARDSDTTSTTALDVIELGTGLTSSCAILSNSSMFCWGTNVTGRDTAFSAPVSLNSTDWTQIDGGNSQHCGLKGTERWCWGSNKNSQLGYLTETGNASDLINPIHVDAPKASDPPDATAPMWATLSMGAGHGCGIQVDNEKTPTTQTLWCWGDNTRGQGGVGAIVDPDNILEEPTQEIAADTTWLSLDAGNNHTCAILGDDLTTPTTKEIFCWGDNTYGQLGTDDKVDLSSKQNALNKTNWIQVSAGEQHTCGLDDLDTIYCWGSNVFGQLGTGDVAEQLTAVTAVQNGGGAITNWTSVSAGGNHTCAINDVFELYCWGHNTYGQLGLGNTAHSAWATKIDHTTGWASVSTGQDHTCAIDKRGTNHCWGLNTDGQTGNGNASEYKDPLMYNFDQDWQSFGSGDTHSCALKTDGTLWCAGANNDGQVGNGTPQSQAIVNEIPVVNTDSTWTSLSVGRRYTCAISTDSVLIQDTLWCWGENNENQLGDVTSSAYPDIWLPQQLTSGTNWASVAAGESHTCAIDSSQAIKCWGLNTNGQLGDATNTSRALPAILDGGGSWKQVAVGDSHTCALDTSDALSCWGDNLYGQLGDATNTDRNTPTSIAVGETWKAVYAGTHHTCALKPGPDNTLWCWGRNNKGQLGDGTQTDTNIPQVVTVSGSAYTWKSISTAGDSICGIRTTSDAYCWGDNTYFQMTSRPALIQKVPASISSAANWLSIDLGQLSGCAFREFYDIDANQLQYSYNGMLCWGLGAAFQISDGSISAWEETPSEVVMQ